MSFRSPSNAYDVVDESEVQEHVAMAVTPGSLYILFLDRNPTSSPQSKLLLVRSDDGLNPLPPRSVEPNQDEDVAHVEGDIAVDGDGTVYVAYGYRSTGEAGIRLATKPAAAGTFTITDVYKIEEDVPRELRPRLAVSDDGVVEIVFDPLGDESRLNHIRSEDGGSTFAEPAVMWVAGATGDTQETPDLAFDDLGRLNVVWSQGGELPPRVYHTISVDGSSFTAPVELNGAWNSSDMGHRGWESDPVIVPRPDGSLSAAYIAHLNNTVGLYFTKMVNEPPEVEITYPANDSQVRGTVPILGDAIDPAGNTGLANVFVQVADGDPVRLKGTTSWEYEFDSTKLEDGWYDISAWATDGFLDGAVVTVRVDVDNNKPPRFTIGTPANGTTHMGFVRVAGTANDTEGFDEGWTVQYSLDEANWTNVEGGVLLNRWNLDYEIELDMTKVKEDSVEIFVRASDGDKFSQSRSVFVNLVNEPDLYIDRASVDWDPVDPKHDDLVSIILTVENRGVVTAESYKVEVTRGAQTVGLATGSNLPPGETETLIVTWDAKGGNNSLKVIVDSQRELDELDEGNNEVLFNILVKKPPADDEESSFPYVLVVVVIAAILGVVGVTRWWLMNRPEVKPEVETVFEGGGMYDDLSGPYSEAQMTQAGEDSIVPDTPTQEAEPVQQMAPEQASEPLDTPPLDSKDPEQLHQDVEIRTEKVERS
jgi:hypothetical protein